MPKSNFKTALILLFPLSISALPNPIAGNQQNGSPLLLGPPGSDSDGSVGHGVTPLVVAPPVTVTATALPSPTGVSVSATDTEDDSSTTSLSVTATTSSISTTSTGTTSTTSTVSSSSSSTMTSSPDQPPPPPFSVKYLTPLFILIAITLLGWVYGKYRNRNQTKDDPFAPSTDDTTGEHGEDECGMMGRRGEWKAVSLDEGDPWYEGEEEYRYQEKYSKTGSGVGWREVSQTPVLGYEGGWNRLPGDEAPTINGGGRGGGGEERKTRWDDWKNTVTSTLRWSSKGRKTTMKLVQSQRMTYTTLPDIQAILSSSNHSTAASSSPVPPVTPSLNISEETNIKRNKSPNKRFSNNVTSSTVTQGQENYPPEAPEWIHPRSTSPTNLLSPPSQPALFFQPIPSPSAGETRYTYAESDMHSSHVDGDSESGSDYGSDDDIDEGFSGVSGGGLKEDENERISFGRGIGGGLGRRRLLDRSSTGAVVGIESPLSSITPDLEGSYTTLPNPAGSIRKKKSLATSPTTGYGKTNDSPMKRSNRLSNVQSLHTTPSTSRTGSTPGTGTGTNGSRTRLRSRTKSRREKKDDKVRHEVEGIIAASWSERGVIASPRDKGEQMSLEVDYAGGTGTELGTGGMKGSRGAGGGVEVGKWSPGVGGGEGFGMGIEQRLAKLRDLEG